jgi:hypothetical protein
MKAMVVGQATNNGNSRATNNGNRISHEKPFYYLLR